MQLYRDLMCYTVLSSAEGQGLSPVQWLAVLLEVSAAVTGLVSYWLQLP